MKTLNKKHNIKRILINKEYSTSGKDFNLSLNVEGINININTLVAIMRLSKYNDIPSDILNYYYSFFKTMNVNYNLDYSLMIGSKKSKEYLNKIKDFIQFSLNKVTDYHLKYFPIRKKACNNLYNVCLNDKILDLPNYVHSSITGRASINKGFNFLTMKKSERKKLKPINDNDMLIEVDFKSCEPFFYINSLNKFPDDNINDVYEFISNKIGYSYKSRDVFKRGLLSVIYGANENTVSKVMNADVNVVKKIKDLLDVNKFEAMLKDEFSSNKCIFNYYGRPILSDANLVNYWIQSSTADFCFLAFDKFIKDYKLRPCFYIHDSMTFLINKNRFDEIKNIKSLNDPNSNISIPVEIIKY